MKSAYGFAVLALTVSSTVHAADVTETYNFILDGFADVSGSAPPPIGSISGSFGVTFDPSVATTGAPVTFSQLSTGAFPSQYYFRVVPASGSVPTQIDIGTVQTSPGNVFAGSTDFALNLVIPNPASPTFLLCGQYGSNCNGATGIASGYTLAGHPNDVWAATGGSITSAAESPPFAGATQYGLPPATASALASATDSGTPASCCLSQLSTPASSLPLNVRSSTSTHWESASATVSNGPDPFVSASAAFPLVPNTGSGEGSPGSNVGTAIASAALDYQIEVESGIGGLVPVQVNFTYSTTGTTYIEGGDGQEISSASLVLSGGQVFLSGTATDLDGTNLLDGSIPGTFNVSETLLLDAGVVYNIDMLASARATCTQFFFGPTEYCVDGLAAASVDPSFVVPVDDTLLISSNLNAVREPGTWALIIVGAGLLGGVTRLKRANATSAAA